MSERNIIHYTDGVKDDPQPTEPMKSDVSSCNNCGGLIVPPGIAYAGKPCNCGLGMMVNLSKEVAFLEHQLSQEREKVKELEKQVNTGKEMYSQLLQNSFREIKSLQSVAERLFQALSTCKWYLHDGEPQYQFSVEAVEEAVKAYQELKNVK